jgi:hypothetical protein
MKGLLQLLDSKRIIEKKIEDIDQMLKDIDIGELGDTDTQGVNSNIDINGLDVLDVLHNILN